jgi:hypothetical protein
LSDEKKLIKKGTLKERRIKRDLRMKERVEKDSHFEFWIWKEIMEVTVLLLSLSN